MAPPLRLHAPLNHPQVAWKRPFALPPQCPNVQLCERISRGGFGIPKIQESNNARRFCHLSILLGGSAQQRFGAAAETQFHTAQEFARASLTHSTLAIGAGVTPQPACSAPWKWFHAFLARQSLHIRKHDLANAFTLEFRAVHASRLFAPFSNEPEREHRKAIELQDFTNFIHSMPSNSICVYTDGSSRTDDSGVEVDGAGFAILWPNGDVWQKSISIGVSGTNSRAELVAIEEALDTLIDSERISMDKDPIIFLSDSEYALGCCAEVSQLSLHHKRIFSIRDKLTKLKGAVLRHVPAHTDDIGAFVPLLGNILADRLANWGANGTNSFEKTTMAMINTDPEIAGQNPHQPSGPPPQDPSSLPFFTKQLTPDLATSLCRRIADDINSRDWIKCADRTDFVLDPIAAKVSATPLRDAATPLNKTRSLIFAKFGLSPAVQTNATRFFARGQSRQCPFGCQCVETQRHLLGGCARQFHGFYTTRHDRVVKMLGQYLKKHYGDANVTYNISADRQGMPPCLETIVDGTEHDVREPDITIIHNSRVHFLEIGIISKPGPDGLTEKEAEKCNQYRELSRFVNAQHAGLTCTCHGIAIGALGTISRVSFLKLSRLLSAVELPPKATKQLCRRMCNSVLRDAEKLFSMRMALRRGSTA